jgi:hypothetical protein
VRVKWLHAVDAAKAFKEVGLFGNQNTVCQPLAAKWRHKVERWRGGEVERWKTVFTGWGG